MVQRGLFVALEGIDGSGTTSQLVPLARHLQARGLEVVTTCEPSRGQVGQLLRRYLAGGEVDEATMALLFAADRLQHVRQEVAPALSAGRVVLCDRYLWSSLAYQTTAPLPLEAAWLRAINAQAPAPALTLMLTVSPKTAQARRARRAEGHERYDDDARQAAVAHAYAALMADARAGGRAAAEAGELVELDAEAPLETVTRAACAALDRALAVGAVL